VWQWILSKKKRVAQKEEKEMKTKQRNIHELDDLSKF
jgi:hypothetical protein